MSSEDTLRKWTVMYRHLRQMGLGVLFCLIFVLAIGLRDVKGVITR